MPEPRKLIIKISAQNIELFKSYPYIKGEKVGPRLLQMSPPNLMIRIWGWHQNVANTYHYNLTEPDFSNSSLLLLVAVFLKNPEKVEVTRMKITHFSKTLSQK